MIHFSLNNKETTIKVCILTYIYIGISKHSYTYFLKKHYYLEMNNVLHILVILQEYESQPRKSIVLLYDDTYVLK